MISTQLAYSSMKLPTANRNLWYLRFCSHRFTQVRLRHVPSRASKPHCCVVCLARQLTRGLLVGHSIVYNRS